MILSLLLLGENPTTLSISLLLEEVANSLGEEMCRNCRVDRNAGGTCNKKGWLISPSPCQLTPSSPDSGVFRSSISTHSFLPPEIQPPTPTANLKIGTMINDPGKNLISCPVVQGWFPIKEPTQDNYFLSTASNLLFNCGHSSFSVWKQNQFLNFHLVNIPKNHRMLKREGTLKAM